MPPTASTLFLILVTPILHTQPPLIRPFPSQPPYTQPQILKVITKKKSNQVKYNHMPQLAQTSHTPILTQARAHKQKSRTN